MGEENQPHRVCRISGRDIITIFLWGTSMTGRKKETLVMRIHLKKQKFVIKKRKEKNIFYLWKEKKERKGGGGGGGAQGVFPHSGV